MALISSDVVVTHLGAILDTFEHEVQQLYEQGLEGMIEDEEFKKCVERVSGIVTVKKIFFFFEGGGGREAVLECCVKIGGGVWLT